MLKSSVFSALVTFVQVAEFPSFSAAAKSLHLTTGAISQQLLQLEDQLGFSLFERHSRGVRLTPQGEMLKNVACRSIGDIEKVIATLRAQSERKEIRLKLTPSFAFKWLVPRLENFYRLHPDIQIQTFAEGALVDSDRRDYDLAIDYGPMPYRRADAELLFEEYLIPVMSPSYLESNSWLADSRKIQRWNEVVLLHDAMPWAQSPRDYEWQFWAEQLGFEVPAHQGHFFNRTDMAMSAAEAGLGIAMARRALLGNELSSHRLVAPLGEVPANAGYFLITHTRSEAVNTLVSWLKEQI